MKTIYSHHISLVPLCKEHLSKLQAQLRQEDQAEMEAAYGLSSLEVLNLCARQSVYALALVQAEEVWAVAGVEANSLLGREACVWSWTGEKVKKYPKIFWQVSQTVLAEFQRLYPCLYAVCMENYSAANRYIQRLGGIAVGKAVCLYSTEQKFQIYRFETHIKTKN